MTMTYRIFPKLKGRHPERSALAFFFAIRPAVFGTNGLRTQSKDLSSAPPTRNAGTHPVAVTGSESRHVS
jgi:hypothetical protein